jgi:hypothetical protein
MTQTLYTPTWRTTKRDRRFALALAPLLTPCLGHPPLSWHDLEPMELKALLPDFGEALRQVDAGNPQHTTKKGRIYQPGIGPHPEDAAVKLVLEKMQLLHPGVYDKAHTQVPYPNSRQKCDLVLGAPPEWRVEVKMARVYGDNNRPDDTGVKDILSPFTVDRSALADCLKLAALGVDARRAVLIYGFDAPQRPVAELVGAFEILARQRVLLGERHQLKLENLAPVRYFFPRDLGDPEAVKTARQQPGMQ